MKMKTAVSLAVCLLLCLIGWTTFAKAQRIGAVSQTWEYRVENVPEKVLSAANDPPQRAAIQNLLTKLGSEGWELAGVGGNYYYFKRPK